MRMSSFSLSESDEWKPGPDLGAGFFFCAARDGCVTMRHPMPPRRLAPLTLLPLLGVGCPRPLAAPSPPPAPRGPLSGVLVVLDPGHGGEDSGTIHAGFREDSLNYRLAAETASELRTRGATVWMTVSSRALPPDLKPGKPEPPLIVPRDARLTFNGERVRLRVKYSANDLWRRAAICQKAVKQPGKKTFFLALHADSLDSRAWWGARVYRDTRDKGESRFAREVLARLTAGGFTFTKTGKIVPRDYGVLNPQYNPIVQKALVEAFTLSSPHDRIRASDPKWRWKVAKLLADSVQKCAKA